MISSRSRWLLNSLAYATCVLIVTCVLRGVEDTAAKSLEHVLSRMRLDGTAKLDIAATYSPTLERLGFQIEAKHTIFVDADGKIISRWTISGLHSYIADGENGGRVWHPPNGSNIQILPGSRSASALLDENGTSYRRRGARDEVITMGRGLQFFYDQGLLTTIVEALGEEYTCAGTAGRIDGIFVESFVSGVSAKPFLRVSYDEFGQPVIIEAESGITKFEWVKYGVLKEIVVPGGQKYSFRYRNDVLENVFINERLTQRYKWSRRKDYFLPRSRVPAPLTLIADIDSQYQFAIDGSGYHLIRNSAGMETEIVVNPNKNVALVRGTNGYFLIDIRKHGNGLQFIP